jgi:hypothetical protein
MLLTVHNPPHLSARIVAALDKKSKHSLQYTPCSSLAAFNCRLTVCTEIHRIGLIVNHLHLLTQPLARSGAAALARAQQMNAWCGLSYRGTHFDGLTNGKPCIGGSDEIDSPGGGCA